MKIIYSANKSSKVTTLMKSLLYSLWVSPYVVISVLCIAAFRGICSRKRFLRVQVLHGKTYPRWIPRCRILFRRDCICCPCALWWGQFVSLHYCCLPFESMTIVLCLLRQCQALSLFVRCGWGILPQMQLFDFFVPSNNPCHRNYAFIFRQRHKKSFSPKNKGLFSMHI